MLYIRIELWPYGDREQTQVLGEATISRINQSDDKTLGDYDCKILKPPDKVKGGTGVWRRGKVMNFPRLKLSCWDLMYRALGAMVAKRNP